MGMQEDINTRLYAYLLDCDINKHSIDLDKMQEDFGYNEEQTVSISKKYLGHTLDMISISDRSVFDGDNWVLNEDLDKVLGIVHGLKKRYCFVKLQDFIKRKRTNYICALYGLRRTGKTVLMYQMIEELIKLGLRDKIAYISFSANTKYTDTKLLSDIAELYKNGIQYIFIDELSYIQMDMEYNCLNSLADKYAVLDMKIVVTGTFSYAIKLLENEVLFDRIEKIDTTYFSYKEANEVFNYDIESFIKYGGFIKDDSKETDLQQYIGTSISRNIAKSLLKSDKVYELINDYDGSNSNKVEVKIELLIKRMIDQYMMQVLYRKVVRSNYRFQDIGKLVDSIKNRELQESVITQLGEELKIDKIEYYKYIEELWGSLTTEDLDEISFTFI